MKIESMKQLKHAIETVERADYQHRLGLATEVMCEEERQVWRQLVKQANRYGHEGKRVIDVDVFCPTTAASDWRPLLILDNGPRTATEEW
jgi:hypothetical protein